MARGLDADFHRRLRHAGMLHFRMRSFIVHLLKGLPEFSHGQQTIESPAFQLKLWGQFVRQFVILVRLADWCPIRAATQAAIGQTAICGVEAWFSVFSRQLPGASLPCRQL
jgi:hypothetical protein